MDQSTRWLRGGLAAAAVGALGLGPAAGAAGAQTATPRFYATSACTQDQPYNVDLHIADFPPNDEFRLIIGYYAADDEFVGRYPVTFRTRSDGSSTDTGITLFGDKPHDIGGLWYRDNDDSGSYTEGDDVILNAIMSIDQPCTGAEATPK